MISEIITGSEKRMADMFEATDSAGRQAQEGFQLADGGDHAAFEREGNGCRRISGFHRSTWQR